jgi:hypothetical protein
VHWRSACVKAMSLMMTLESTSTLGALKQRPEITACSGMQVCTGHGVGVKHGKKVKSRLERVQPLRQELEAAMLPPLSEARLDAALDAIRPVVSLLPPELLEQARVVTDKVAQLGEEMASLELAGEDESEEEDEEEEESEEDPEPLAPPPPPPRRALTPVSLHPPAQPQRPDGPMGSQFPRTAVRPPAVAPPMAGTMPAARRPTTPPTRPVASVRGAAVPGMRSPSPEA